MSRNKGLTALRRAIRMAGWARLNGIPANELADMERHYQRRQFIKDAALISGGLLLGGSLLQSCEKPGELSNKYNIAIVGGGIAGLTCAWYLKEKGLFSTIYEGSSRFGGRVLSARNLIGEGQVTELGAEFIDTAHLTIRELCLHFGLNLLDVRLDPGLEDIYYFNNTKYTHADVIREIAEFLPAFASDAARIPDPPTYANASDFSDLDALSLKDYLQSKGVSGWLYKYLEFNYLTEFGLEIDSLSAVEFLYIAGTEISRSVDGFTNEYSIFGESDERYKIIGGNQKLPEALVASLNESQLKESHNLLKIDTDAGGKYLLTFQKASGTETVTADFVVLALPFSTLKNCEIACYLPPQKLHAINELGYGTNSKLLLSFSEPIWRNNGLNGNFTSEGSLQYGWDNTRIYQPYSKQAGITVFSGGTEGANPRTGISPQQEAESILPGLEKLFPGISGKFTGRASRMLWPQQPFSLGSYSAWKPGQVSTISGYEKQYYGNLMFAGEHCDPVNQGYMEGAAKTGKEAALEIFKRIS